MKVNETDEPEVKGLKQNLNQMTKATVNGEKDMLFRLISQIIYIMNHKLVYKS
jgi:hypothetical protein